MQFRLAVGVSLAVVSIILVGTGRAGDAVKSGLAPGSFAGAFEVEDITGPNAGRTLCYR